MEASGIEPLSATVNRNVETLSPPVLNCPALFARLDPILIIVHHGQSIVNRGGHGGKFMQFIMRAEPARYIVRDFLFGKFHVRLPPLFQQTLPVRAVIDFLQASYRTLLPCHTRRDSEDMPV
jgi:hypothetical protein